MERKDITKELPPEQIQALREAEIAFKKNPTLIPLDDVMKEVDRIIDGDSKREAV